LKSYCPVSFKNHLRSECTRQYAYFAGYETWSLALGVGRKLQVFKKQGA
jgi:hypothetical protein